MFGVHSVELLIFLALVIAALWVDLFVLHKDDHAIGLKEAAWTSAAWIGTALLFSGYVFWQYGSVLWMQFLAAYALEKALSIDNIFVIAMIFSFFRLKNGLQHRALVWGVVGAIVMRGLLILVGVGLVQRFNWLLPIFGAFLLYTAYKMLTTNQHEMKIEDNKVYRWFVRVLPVYPGLDGNKIITQYNGRRALTTLGIAIVMVELTDLVFALDSIPAVMGISQDGFIILTSNVFAILGLRALYFLLAGILDKFRYLKLGLSLVLGFIGLKMLALPFGLHIPIEISLLVVLGVLATAVIASLLLPLPSERPEG